MSTSVEQPVAAAAAEPLYDVREAGPRQRAWLGYADAMRIGSMMAIVVGHVADMVLFDRAKFGTAGWWYANVADALSRFAVPLYVMLSGSLLLAMEKTSHLKEFYIRRFTRVGVPLVVWSAFYMLFDAYYTGWAKPPGKVWENLLRGSPYAHLHFLFVIVGLYLFSPMLRVFVLHAPRKMLWLTVILTLGLGAANSTAAVATHAQPNAFFRFVPFVGYFLAGYLLRDVKVSRTGVWWCLAGAAACAGVVAVSAWWFTAHWDAGALTGYPSWGMSMYDFLSLPRVIMALCVWVVFASVFDDDKRPAEQSWLRRELVAATLGIALVHPAIRDVLHVGACSGVSGWMWGALGVGGISANWPSIWVGLPLVSAVVWALSAAATMGLRRVPVVRWAMG